MIQKKIHLIAAARPNFMKIAPLYHCLASKDWAEPVIVHTGQHYDLNMSDVFFQDLSMPSPHIHLGVGSGTHAKQTGGVMIAYEKVLIENRPDLTVVVGDVNSTVACTLAACKLGVETAHLEAGLRSFDRSMPEEINRVVTDAIADHLWTPSIDGDENLLHEGIPQEKITRVGNIMIDTLVMMTPAIERENTYSKLGLNPRKYGVVTLHRPSNVDNENSLKKLISVLTEISKKLLLVFPVHPRTRNQLSKFGMLENLAKNPSFKIMDPLGYKAFMNLLFNARLAITDSGGLREETTYLGLPCLTLRPNTERPVTITDGTNRLTTPERLAKDCIMVLDNRVHTIPNIDLWDGATAERVVQAIREI